jgi:hypothetical protein
MVRLFRFVAPFRFIPSTSWFNNEEKDLIFFCLRLIFFRGEEVRVSVSDMERGARLVGDLEHS